MDAGANSDSAHREQLRQGCESFKNTSAHRAAAKERYAQRRQGLSRAIEPVGEGANLSFKLRPDAGNAERNLVGRSKLQRLNLDQSPPKTNRRVVTHLRKS